MQITTDKSIKVLVLVTDYPGEGRKEAHRFVHVRNLHYQTQGIGVTVLNFSAKADYSYEGIRVITMDTFKNEKCGYDLLIAHQANVRKHYLFLRKYGDKFPHFILFFHGHEVLRFSKTYPKPYDYVSSSKLKAAARDCYDLFKLSVWHSYIPKIIHKSTLVFVSQWMLDEFLKATGLHLEDLKGNYDIIYNCVGLPFQENRFDHATPKTYDFVTIRSNLDGSTYCIDIVNELAKSNPKSKFLVVGKGKFFDHREKAPNLTWENRTLNHWEIIETLQTARCALMPTKTDSQGLMTCEMATFCMPVITSDIPVCHQVLSSFENVALISNQNTNIDLNSICEKLERGLPFRKNEMFFDENTCAREVEVIQSLLQSVN